jgi:hypothetical protein
MKTKNNRYLETERVQRYMDYDCIVHELGSNC